MPHLMLKPTATQVFYCHIPTLTSSWGCILESSYWEQCVFKLLVEEMSGACTQSPGEESGWSEFRLLLIES